MLVQSDTSFLGNLGQKKPSRPSEDKGPQAFKDILADTGKRKDPVSKKQQSPAPLKKRKDNKNEFSEPDAPVEKVVVAPVKKVVENAEAPVAKVAEPNAKPNNSNVKGLQDQSIGLQTNAKDLGAQGKMINEIRPQVTDLNTSAPAATEGSIDLSSLENLEVAETKISLENQNPLAQKNSVELDQKTELVDSLNLSEVENKTLIENQKTVQSRESSLQQLMAQSKLKPSMDVEKITEMVSPKLAMATAAPTTGLVTQKTIAGQNALKANSPVLKIGASEDVGFSAMAESDFGLPVVAKSSEDDAKMDNSPRDFDATSMMAVEQDIQTENSGQGAFVEELTVAQGSEKSEKIENMQAIVKQAKAIVDDGGGSMEIHLQPEGLGKIHLKVAVNDGQVNVEMLADNAMAKKALEEGLMDIKNALEGQKLLVDTLKVEMSQDYQKDFSDLQNHFQEQANRDFAEQFLGQFRQEREERFGGMFDAFKSFQRGPEDPELSLQRNPYIENGKGRSINLVA